MPISLYIWVVLDVIKQIRIPKILRNFYVSSSVLLFMWLLFFDGNDLITLAKTAGKVHDAERQKEYYLQKIEEVKQNKAELLGNKYLLEKYAREKYLMKKPSEDIYLIEEEQYKD